ncbi:MAG: hypothetical protein AB1443_10640 [Pseudomonadota bacterium]
MLVWLGICAVAAFVAALVALLLAVPPAPTFHIFFAAGAMPLIFGAIIHFVPVLTRSGSPAPVIRFLPLLLQCAGVVTPLGLAGLLPEWSLHAAATLAAGSALALLVWTTRRLRATFGTPHPGARWYGAALLCLFLAVSLVPVWLALPDLRPALRLFHLHLNTLGFIGLAALGTLPVLLPTTLGRLESTAVDRLLHDLPIAVIGAILVAAGTISTVWLAAMGALLMIWVAVRNLLAWQSVFGLRSIVGAGGTASLAGATLGFAVLLILGVVHGLGWVEARPSLAAYVALFLLPLVTGALSHLLPVWRYPGVAVPARSRMTQRLAHGGQWRALLFLAGGLLLAFEVTVGLLPVAAGLALFAYALVRAFWLDRAGASDDNSRPIP